MKVQDFRIGNMVNYFHHETCLNGIVTSINKKSITINNHATIKIKSNNISPIALTEEWLLKFGFELKNQLSIHKTKIYYISNIEVDYCIYFADFRQDFGFYIEYTDSPYAKDEGVLYPITFGIKYVHQLQNLYYALNGEELKMEGEK